ncbi:cytochrome c551 peroxidase [Vibrio variabilis]|uniref:Cytochrome c551 peroxidase n=1 Tax=Vibrio variabilis TaxID=990271 RepID=A0ABQ0JJP7_9VIBR|nr:cytochrome c551 peroxidase [Vibrio variabilis]
MKNKKLLVLCMGIMLSTVGLLLWDGYSSLQHNDRAMVETKDHYQHEVHDHNHERQTPPVSNSSSIDFPIQPVPPESVDKDLARLGWVLFRDPNLSSNKQISCESCHELTTSGSDPRPLSVGVNGLGKRNSLTVFNVSDNYRFFWDGRVNTLEDQIDGPVHEPFEMDTDWKSIVEYTSSSSRYKELFERVSLSPSESSVKQALVEFMRSLKTLNAPFDRYIAGDTSAIDDSAERGWQAFQSLGCIGCHRGSNVGGGMVMQFGYFGLETRGTERSKDLGRFSVTSKQEDKHLFRVASLRNVAVTAHIFTMGKLRSWRTPS